MTAELHITPARATNADGTNLSGAKWFFYETGTTTPLSVYTTAALSVAHANPVVADSGGKFAAIYFDSTKQYRGILKTSDEATTIYDIDPINAGVMSQLAESGGAALIGFLQSGTGAVARTAQGKMRDILNAKDFGCAFDNATDDTTELASAITEGTTTVNGAQGATINLPRGTAVLSATQNIPNRVHINGENKRGSVLKAASGHTGPYMFTVVNGTSSTFDNALQDLTVNCNNVAGLGGVLSDAWQEGGGMRNVLVQNFRTYGVRFQNGYGGAALCKISDCELFGSSTAAPTAGIRVDQISVVGNFMLYVEHSTIAGDASFPLPKGIDIDNDSLFCTNVHFEDTTSGIYLDGVGDHVLTGVTGGPGVTNVVEIASTFTGTLTMIGCFRGGATNLLLDNRTNGYGTVNWDADIQIVQEPPMGAYAIARGTFNGTTVGSPALTYIRGVTSITRTSDGLYSVVLARALSNANMIVPMVTARAGANVLAAPDITLTGTNSFTIQLKTVGGTAIDSDEIKLAVFRF